MKNIYNIKIKISKAPNNGIKYKNVFTQGLSIAKNPTIAKEQALNTITTKGYDGLVKEVVSCVNLKSQFVVDPK